MDQGKGVGEFRIVDSEYLKYNDLSANDEIEINHGTGHQRGFFMLLFHPTTLIRLLGVPMNKSLTQ